MAYTGSRRSGLQGWDYFRTDAENRARYTHAVASRPHNLVFSYNYLVPDGGRLLGGGAIARGVLDGWQISGVSILQTGTLGGQANPNANGTITYTFTGAPTGDLTQGLGGSRVTFVCDPNLPRGDRTEERQLRTECVRPAGPTSDPSDTLYQGTSLGDEWRGLGYVNHDITFFKNFAMGGQRNLQIRIEMYNAFNTVQYGTVDTSAVFDLRDRASRPTRTSAASRIRATTRAA